MTRPISQREAHRLRKQVQELLAQRDKQTATWSRDYPGGVHLGTWTTEKDWFWGALSAAQKLKHVLVVKVEENGACRFYAVKP